MIEPPIRSDVEHFRAGKSLCTKTIEINDINRGSHILDWSHVFSVPNGLGLARPSQAQLDLTGSSYIWLGQVGGLVKSSWVNIGVAMSPFA